MYKAFSKQDIQLDGLDIKVLQISQSDLHIVLLWCVCISLVGALYGSSYPGAFSQVTRNKSASVIIHIQLSRKIWANLQLIGNQIVLPNFQIMLKRETIYRPSYI